MADQTPERWKCKTCGYFNDDKADEKCARCGSLQERNPHIPDTPPADNLEKTPIADVKAIAAASGVEGADKMKKTEVIDAIREIKAPSESAPAGETP